jgi:hypothetical protein
MPKEKFFLQGGYQAERQNAILHIKLYIQTKLNFFSTGLNIGRLN